MAPDEKSGQESAATLEEAMARQDQLAREKNGTAAEEGEATLAEEHEAANAELAEAGAAQEARDDEVYGRVAGAEDRRPGVGDVPEAETEPTSSAKTDTAKSTSTGSKSK